MHHFTFFLLFKFLFKIFRLLSFCMAYKSEVLSNIFSLFCKPLISILDTSVQYFI